MWVNGYGSGVEVPDRLVLERDALLQQVELGTREERLLLAISLVKTQKIGRRVVACFLFFSRDTSAMGIVWSTASTYSSY